MKLTKFGIFFALCLLVTSATIPAFAQTQTAEKNMLIVFDASGSMTDKFGAVSRMDALKSATDFLLSNLDAGIYIGLRPFANIKKDTEIEACKVTSLLQDFTLDRSSIKSQVKLLQAVGSYTPLAYTLEQTKKDFTVGNDNVVILLTDGKDTCNGNPAQAAADLYNSTLKARVCVIGLDVDSVSKVQLQDIAQKGGCSYYDAKDSDSLLAAFNMITEKEKPIERVAEISPLGGEEMVGANEIKGASNYTVYSANFNRETNQVENLYSYNNWYHLKDNLAPRQYAYFQLNICKDDYKIEKVKEIPNLTFHLKIGGDRMGVNYNQIDNTFEEANLHNFKAGFFDLAGFEIGKSVEVKNTSMIKDQVSDTGLISLLTYEQAREIETDLSSCHYYLRVGSDDYAISKYDLFKIDVMSDGLDETVSSTATTDPDSSDDKKGRAINPLYIISGVIIGLFIITIVILVILLKKKNSTLPPSL